MHLLRPFTVRRQVLYCASISPLDRRKTMALMDEAVVAGASL